MATDRRGSETPDRPMPRDRVLRIRLPARASQLAVVRRRLESWLDGAGVSAEESAVVALAASEAASNAVEHAYGTDAGWFELVADIDERVLTIVVRDGGEWRRKARGAGGRGLGLIGRLMDELELRRGERGTEVWMRRALVGKQ